MGRDLGWVFSVALIGLLALGCGGGEATDGLHAGLVTTPTSSQVPREFLAPTPTSPPPIPTAVPNPRGVGRDDRFIVQKLGINAPLSYKKLTNNEMPNPDGPDDVAYYDLSSVEGLGGEVGKGGNAVFAGHVDSGRVACKNGSIKPPCQAVFWGLDSLEAQDVIEVLVSGSTYRYQVTSSFLLDGERSTKWTELLTATGQETLTIITCEGKFNERTSEYDSRRVIQAVRVT